MRNDKKPKILVIVGPTASGKSDLAVKLAKRYNGEIISADSRQVYRGMDIGTGKVLRDKTLPVPNLKFKNQNLKLRNNFYSGGVKHHLLDIASPKSQFTAAQYQKLGQAAIKKILRKGKFPVIVGGTGFYIDALVYGHTLPDVKANPKLRAHFDKLSAKALFERLRKLDPARAKNIDRFNKRRLIRALEIVMTTGKPVPKIVSSIKYQVLSIGTKISDAELKKRIKKRLLQRMKQGPPRFLYGKLRRINMIAEVELLHKFGKVSWKRLDDFGLEYRWVSRYLRNLITKQEMLATLEKEIWHYAKRQMTWWKRDKEIHWVSNYRETLKIIKSLL